MAYRPKDTQDRILHRLKIAKGHLEKVIRMVSDGDYCIEIVRQSQAIQQALKEVDNLMMENHLKSCVVDQIKQGKSETAVNEIVTILKSR